MKKGIKTLNQLAAYINSQDDYPLDVEDICTANGWEICKSDYDIAIDRDNNEKLSFTGEGDKVDVSPYRGGARTGAGRPTLYPNKKKVLMLISEDNINKIDDYAKKEGMSKSDSINYILDSFFSSHE